METLAQGGIAKGGENRLSRRRVNAQRKTETLGKGYEEIPPCLGSEEVLQVVPCDSVQHSISGIAKYACVV